VILSQVARMARAWAVFLLASALTSSCGRDGSTIASADADTPTIDADRATGDATTSADASESDAITDDAPVACNVERPAASICAGVRFHKQDYLDRESFNYGDSWMMTWGPDGETYANFSDGRFPNSDKQSNALLRIASDPPDLHPNDLIAISEDPLTHRASWSHYIISTLFVGETLYVGMVDLSKNSGIARSDDQGLTLDYDRLRPMWTPADARPFMYPSFLQHGKAYEGNADGFVYVYGSDGNWGKTNTLRLARIARDGNLLDLSQYRYYTGDGWSEQLADAADILLDGNNLGGMQSIVFNPALQRYFLVTFAEPATEDARMIVYDAPKPWGPWYRCGIIEKESALFFDTSEIQLRSYVYNPSFNAKWIEDDGDMWISYANYTPRPWYSFHYGRVEIVPGC
jgi:hypothetical protein